MSPRVMTGHAIVVVWRVMLHISYKGELKGEK